MVTVADYAALSAASYGSSTVDGWQAIQTRSDPATGFSATLFQNSNGDLVLAFAGTNPVSLADWSNSINAMTTGTQPPQFNQAMDFYNQLVGQYGAEAISLTGHSLGGALASWVAAQSVSQPPPNTTVFNAFGISNFVPNQPYSNISNYNTPLDPVSGLGPAQIGNQYPIGGQGIDPNVIGLFGLLGFFGGLMYLLIQNHRIQPLVGTNFTAGQAWIQQRRDPLTFDLDGDGIETVPTTGGVLFDHDGDGLKQGTGWIGSDDGFLVLDRNANGTIDDGTELFGDSTPLYAGGTAVDGFQALVQEDTNADGVVSSLDARWNDLRIWRDLDQDGISDAGELFTLSDLNIASINVASTAHNQTLANGNQIADLGTYTRSDGSTGTVAETSDLADVNLATDTFQREFTDQIPLAEGVSTLPNMQGSGLVRDLWEAMSQSSSLQALVQQFAAATTKAEQMAILDSLLDAWADTSGLADSLDDRTSAYKIRYMAFGAVTRGSHVSAAEGGGTLDTDATSVELADDVDNLRLDAEYKALIEAWNAKIHTLEAFNGRYFFTLPGETQAGISAVTGETIQSTGKYYDAASGVQTLMISYSQAQLDLLQQSYDALRESVYGALVVQTRLQTYLNQVELTIDEGGVHLNFTSMEAAFQAKAASDGYNAVVDLLDMRKYMGAQLQGMNWSPYPTLGEVVRSTTFTPEIAALLTTERIQVLGASDTSFTVTDTKGSIVIGNNVENTLVGISAAPDLLVGAGGNDTLRAVGWNDTLDGGEGDDNLGISGSMNVYGTTYIGGRGNDTIVGAYHSDVYVFNLGDGQDTVTDNSANYSNFDVLRFGTGIASADVTPVRVGLDLVFQHVNGTDRITFKNWFSSTFYQVEQIEFADGTVWTVAQVNAWAGTVVGTEDADTLTGVVAFADALFGMGGNDTLRAVGGSDTLDGGEGDDNLGISGSMNVYGTTFIGGRGNDTVVGAYHSDVYVFNLGDGQDTVTDYSANYSNFDVLKFGADIAPGDIMPLRSGEDLLFKHANGTDQITFKNWFTNGFYQVERVDFADGTSWTLAQVNTRALEVFGTEGADTMTGVVAFGDVLRGLGGNDTLRALGANDTLDGGEGDDNLGISGSMTVSGTTHIGGRGNDTIVGAYQSDVYVFNLGDGQDTITDNSANYSNFDVLRFGTGISPTDITPLRSGEDLLFKHANGTDQITFKNWFTNGFYQMERVDFADGMSWTLAQVNARALEVFGTEGTDTLTGVVAFGDVLRGMGGNDTLRAVGGSDTLDGGAGDDDLGISGSMNVNGTTFIGGAGNDTIVGAYNSDVYVFNLGDGQDTVTDYSANYSNFDVLRFGADIAPADITPIRAGLDLMFQHANGTDQITFKNWFASGWYQVERVDFADGTSWTLAQVNARALEVFGTEGADTLTGVVAFGDVLRGMSGNDTLRAVGGSDTLDGGEGDDDLGISGSMNVNGTTFIGGAGNDTVVGAYNSDVYVFNLGDGQDTITDYSANYSNFDVLKFGADIAPADVAPVRTGLDLVFQHANGADQITFKNWFASGWYQVERVDFADGTSWTSTAINAKFNVVNGTAGADTISGLADRYNVISGLDGNDMLTGANSHDRLDGGNGDDAMAGQGGNDTYVVNSASDSVTELVNEGVDFVESSITYTLPENLEHLTLTGTAAIDGTGNDLDNAIAGNGASNLLSGGTGNDNLNGASGDDILQGEDGTDTLVDAAGAAYFSGGGGNDSITGGNGAEVFIGGTGNDVITAGNGADLIVFNQGDGLDTVNGGIGTDNTLSLGNGIRYAELSFRKEASDLILDTGVGDSITFRDWYTSSANNKSISTLQVILDATADYDAESADPTLNNKVEQFDFAGLAAEFDQALTATPTLTSWALTNALSDYHLAGSDSAALGGDLAYYYGTNGNVTGMSVTAAQDVIGNASLGTANQTLREFSGISGGASTLR